MTNVRVIIPDMIAKLGDEKRSIKEIAAKDANEAMSSGSLVNLYEEKSRPASR
jgi:hypothetical protein